MKCPNPTCKNNSRRLETKKTFDELTQIRRVKACPKCGTRTETIELFKGVHDREISDAERHAQELSNIIGQRRIRSWRSGGRPGPDQAGPRGDMAALAAYEKKRRK
jgi:transcriptional regulator NrdR family protein